MSTTGGDLIQSDYIGIDATGTIAAPNGTDGVAVLFCANNNTIRNNVISGNKGNAIRLDGSNFRPIRERPGT